MAGFDDIKDKSLLSGKAQELLKSRQERVQNKSVQEVRILEKIAQDMAEIDKISAELTKNFEKDQVQELSRLSARVEEMKKLAQRVESGRAHGADKQFKQAVNTMTSSSSNLSDISAASRASNNLGMSIGMAQNMSTSALEDTIAKGKSLIGRQSDRIRDTSGHIEGSEGSFTSQMAVRERLINNVGQAQAAMQAQKRLGLDNQSSYYNAVDVTQRVRQDQERNAISSGVAQGQFGNRKQVEEQMDSVAKRLIATFEALDSAIQSGTKDTNDLSKEFNTLEKEYKRHKDVLGEMGRNGGGGGSGLSYAGGIIGNMGTIGMGVANVYRNAGVTSELAQQQNRIGMANLTASRFGDTYGATQGDMSSLRRVMSDQYGEQVRRGLLLGGREDTAKGIETVSSAAKAVGTGIDAATGTSGIWAGVKGFFTGGPAGAAGGAVTEGLAKATPDAANAINSGVDYVKQISQHQTMLQAAQQQRALQDAVSQISDQTSQAAYDQQKGLTYATRGLGVGGVGSNYYGATSFRGSGALGETSSGIVPISDEGQGLNGKSSDIPKLSGSDMDMARSMIMGKEGLSLKGYQDTSKGHSIGYGHFVPGGAQAGMHISKEQANSMFDDDMATHSAGARKMVGEEAFAKLSNPQRAALYDLSYNAGPGALGYGKENSIASRLKRGDISGAGEKILSTATTAGGEPSAAVEARRRQEYAMFSGGETGVGAGVPGGLSTSGIRGGGDRQRVQEMLTDPSVIASIAQQAGLSGKEVNHLTSMGVSGMGKEFGRNARSDITRAGELSRIGYTQSPEQYMQARSQMTGSGGDASNFEEILKNAVANGMDSSKNIMEMVNATSSLASKSAQQGIAAFGGASEQLGRGIDALRGTGVSENMATAAAAKAAGMAESTGQHSGMDIGSVVESARLRKSFGNASLQQMESMRRASPQQLAELRNKFKAGDTAGADELSTKMGIYGQVHSVEDVDHIQGAKREKQNTAAMGFGVNPRMEKSIKDKNAKGIPLSREERSFYNGMTNINLDGTSGDAFNAAINYNQGPAKGNLAKAPGGQVGSGEDTIRAGATGDAKVYAAGVENMTKAMGSMEALGSTMMKVSEALKPEEFSKSVKEAADKLQVPMGTFSKSVSDFNTAVGSLVNVVQKMLGNKGTNMLDNVNPLQNRK